MANEDIASIIKEQIKKLSAIRKKRKSNENKNTHPYNSCSIDDDRL